MKRYSVLPVIIALAGAVQAQKVSEIFEQLSAPKPASPAVTAEPGLTVSQPAAAIEPVAETVVMQTVSQPAVVEVVAPAPVVAVEAVSAAAERKEEVDEVIQTIAAQPEAEVSAAITGGLITLSLKEVELNSVIRLFATLSGANIIIPDLGTEAGVAKVDINLKDVAWRPALQAILDSHDLELFEKIPGSQVYSVRKKLADAPPPMHVKAFRLNYATVAGVSDMLRSMVPEPGKISVFPARNTIVVQSSPENLVEVEYMISSVDFPRQQVFIEAKFLELTDRASEQLGIDWQVLGGYGVGVKGIGGSYSYEDSKVDGINRSSSAGANRFTDIAGRRYERLDEKPEVPVLDPFGNLVNNVDYPARPGSFGPDDSRTYGLIPTTLQETLNGVTSVDASTVSRTLGATLSASDFALVLAALKEVNGTKIVSNPKIIVSNEETAKIYIGTKEPNIKQETTQVENTAPITTYNLDPDMPYFEYGIKLDVTPTVNTADNISVAISPSLTRFLRNKQAGDANTFNTFPVTTEKTINTFFSLQNGQTAAIGGLTELSANDTERKVPLLGSLPLIGRFFSYSSKLNEQTETVIFVTVGLANPSNIDMETGLPQNSTLAMRYEIQARADRQIQAEKIKFLDAQEKERAQREIKILRDAELDRLLKQAEDKNAAAEGI